MNIIAACDSKLSGDDVSESWWDGFERPLNERGLSEVRRVGRWMASQIEEPQLIISSSARRARETIERVCEVAGWSSDLLSLTRSMYLADPATIHKIIDVYLRDRDRIMIVGHNPGLELVFRDYDTDMVPSAGETLMSVASIAVISLSGPSDSASGKWDAKTEQLLQVDALD
ncbi:MAG: hypothetical protein GKR95_04320 [Gammaproteobacteria bacterium]|nr:hypothetical protein [Gammaproteobacteria bacterium]